MPNWFQNTLSNVGDAVDNLADDVLDKLGDVLDGLDLGPEMERIKDAAISSNTLAKETTTLCESTHSKADQMMEFCLDLKETLETSTQRGISPETLDTIQDLLSGEKLHTAMELAKEMSLYAKDCVDKSVQMVTIMEDAMEALPDPVQNALDKVLREKPPSNTEATEESDPASHVTSMDRDIADVQDCLTAIDGLNLMTALKVGMQAMEQFSIKAKTSREMFTNICGYAREIADITEAFYNLDFKKIILHKVKAIWKCLKLSSLIKTMAEGLGNLIQLVVDLFEATSTKVAGLWKALAFAKDCMKDCIEYAMQARGLCENAKEKSGTLIDRSTRIRDMLQDIGDFDAGSLPAIRDLADGEEIRTAITIATEMDDIVLECATKAVAMVDRVREGFSKLPAIVTEGVSKDAGTRDFDPEPANVDDNIVDLEACRKDIQEANVIMAVKAGSAGFANVSDKGGIARELLRMLQDFAETCMKTIESFMGVWDIQTAIERIQEMCRIVKVGEMMSQFAEQIKRLLLALIDLMNETINKFKSMKLGNITQGAAELVENLHLDDLANLGLNKLGSMFS